MKRLFLLLCFFATYTDAAPFVCMPATSLSPYAEGSKIISVVTAAGKADGYWCPTGDPKGSQFVRQELIVLNKYAASPNDVIRRVIFAADFVTAINTELSLAIVPAPNSTDEFEYKTLQYNLCQAMITKPYAVNMNDPPAGYCGTPPVLPVASYVTPSSGVSYTIYKTVNGKISSIVSGKKSTAGAACDCSNQIISGTTTYCALVGGINGEVTQCVKAK